MVHARQREQYPDRRAQLMAGTGSYFNSSASANPLTSWSFAFRAAMASVRTTIPVQVIAIHGGGLAPVGRVDVQPLIQQTDSAGNVMALPVLYGLPYLRWQGGASAVILDPAVNDIGLVCFADRDVSAVIASARLKPPVQPRRRVLHRCDAQRRADAVSAVRSRQWDHDQLAEDDHGTDRDR